MALKQVDKPAFVSYWGHGYSGSLVGSEPGARFGRRLVTTQSFRPIDGEIIKELKGSIVVTLACLALNDLGPDLVAKGVGVFSGSKVKMKIGRADVDGDEKDDFTQLFTEIPRALMEGDTLAHAVTRFKALGHHYADLCEKASCPLDYRKAMLDDADNYGWVGDGTLRVNQQRPAEAPGESHALFEESAPEEKPTETVLAARHRPIVF